MHLLITWRKCSVSYSQYGFMSSQSTADLLTVVSDEIAGAFNRSWATWTVVLGRSKAFERVWHAGLLHKLKSCEVLSQILFYLFPVIDSFEWF